jgi:hypothetical protein
MARGQDTGRHPNRQVGRGSFGRGVSDLPRLQNMLANQLEDEWYDRGDSAWYNSGPSAFTPNFDQAVNARLSNYRHGRNFADDVKEPLASWDMDTAKEIGRRFRNRHN